MKNIANLIVEDVSDFHPRHSMSRCKARYAKKYKRSVKTSRYAMKTKPGSVRAKFGSCGHSEFWD